MGIGCFNPEGEVQSSLFTVEEYGGSWSLFKLLRNRKLHPTHPHVQFMPEDCIRYAFPFDPPLPFNSCTHPPTHTSKKNSHPTPARLALPAVPLSYICAYVHA
jgi:hypothetical protein